MPRQPTFRFSQSTRPSMALTTKTPGPIYEVEGKFNRLGQVYPSKIKIGFNLDHRKPLVLSATDAMYHPPLSKGVAYSIQRRHEPSTLRMVKSPSPPSLPCALLPSFPFLAFAPIGYFFLASASSGTTLAVHVHRLRKPNARALTGAFFAACARVWWVVQSQMRNAPAPHDYDVVGSSRKQQQQPSFSFWKGPARFKEKDRVAEMMERLDGTMSDVLGHVPSVSSVNSSSTLRSM
jgi:hypothetical protein